ncbi:hypothetical protein EYZ11_009976 [Aspergillus tanneri]|uniref:Uncharacterized protein n=1 Tax=Aspergillus tanneri TaxID=1220188 RepID=A0A4S3J6S3_9EURO|nr:hypothetical protein EYZ11_009976 [Aspergillus tanneri]
MEVSMEKLTTHLCETYTTLAGKEVNVPMV